MWFGATAALTRRVNASIAPNRINAVLFKEIVVQ
jgi:flagellar FliL protein